MTNDEVLEELENVEMMLAESMDALRRLYKRFTREALDNARVTDEKCTHTRGDDAGQPESSLDDVSFG